MAEIDFPLPLEPDFVPAFLISVIPFLVFISLAYFIVRPKFISWIYLLMLPGMLIPTVFYTDMAFLHRLFIAVLAPVIYLQAARRTKISLCLSVVLIISSLFLIKPGLNLPLWFTNSLNDLRGQHTPGILARVLHNKSDLWFYFLHNLSTYLSPVAIFAAHRFSYRIQIPLDQGTFPVGLLFPWDFVILLYSVRKFKPNPVVITLACLTALNLNPQLTQIYSHSLVFSLALFLSGFYAKFPPPISYLIACLLLIFTPLVLLSYLPASNLLL